MQASPQRRGAAFELLVDGYRALTAYRRFPGRIVLVHTEVPQPLEGHGLAARLARFALDFAASIIFALSRSAPTSPISFASTLSIRISFVPKTWRSCCPTDSASHVLHSRRSEILASEILYPPPPPH